MSIPVHEKLCIGLDMTRFSITDFMQCLLKFKLVLKYTSIDEEMAATAMTLILNINIKATYIFLFKNKFKHKSVS